MSASELRPASRRFWRALLVSIVLLLGFLWLLRAGALPILPEARAFATVNWGAVWAYAAMWTLIHLTRSARWVLLLRPLAPVSAWRCLLVALVGAGAQVMLPFRTGEMVRPTLIQRHMAVPWLAALSTVAAERVVDGLMLSSLLGVALLTVKTIDPLPTQIGELPIPAALVPTLASSAVLVFLCLFVAMCVFYFKRSWVDSVLAGRIERFLPPLGGWLFRGLKRLSEGLSFLAHAPSAAAFVAVTCAYWAVSVLSMHYLFGACGIFGASLMQTLVVLGVIALGVAVPNAPGYFGAFQMAGYAALVTFLPIEVVTNAGSVYLFLLYAIQIGVTLGLALVALVIEQSLKRAVGVG